MVEPSPYSSSHTHSSPLDQLSSLTAVLVTHLSLLVDGAYPAWMGQPYSQLDPSHMDRLTFVLTFVVQNLSQVYLLFLWPGCRQPF